MWNVTDYNNFRSYIWEIQGFDTEKTKKIFNLFKDEIDIHDLEKFDDSNSILRAIVCNASDEKTVLQLLQLIHQKNDTFIKTQDTKGLNSLLYLSLINNQWHVFDFLLKTVKTPIDTRGKLKHTALYMIAKTNFSQGKPWIRALLENNADPYHKDEKEGLRPIDFITDKELLDLIQQRQSQPLSVSSPTLAPQSITPKTPNKKTPDYPPIQQNPIIEDLKGMWNSAWAFFSPSEPTARGYFPLSQKDDDIKKKIPPTKGMKLKTE